MVLDLFSDDLMAPNLAIYVEDSEIPLEITKDVMSIEYEHTIDMVSMLSMEIANVDHKYTDSTIWSPGNEVDLYLGYGPSPGFCGRAEIVRHLPRFPADGPPTLTIKGYNKVYKLQKQELEIEATKKKVKKKKSRDESIDVFDTTVQSFLEGILQQYDISLEISSELAYKPAKFVQKKGTDHYKMIRALANIHGAEFFVDWLPDSEMWMAYFLIPGTRQQEARYKFDYGGDTPTLISAELEFALPQIPTEVSVWVFDKAKKDWVLITKEESEEADPETFSPGTFGMGGALGAMGTTSTEASPIESSTQFKLGISGYSHLISTRQFDNPEDALDYIEKWYRENADEFVQIRGMVPGLPKLRAGDVHEIDGIGKRYSGDYYFSMVKHKFDADSGYVTEFSGRKVMK